MATVLDLAREVRHRLASKDTGRLTIQYAGQIVAIFFHDGNIATERLVFLSCFVRNPIDFEFKPMKVKAPEEPGFGASILVEAIEAIPTNSLVHIWEPYAEWQIRFRMDPDIHNSLVKEHLTTKVERLRRLLRLSVSGSVTLEPPKTSINDEIEGIERAFKSGNWRKVLGLSERPAESEMKQAYRKLARRFHPDRWVTSPDMKLRDRIEKTFQNISHAYSELQTPRRSTPRLLIGQNYRKPFWERMAGLIRFR